MIRPVFEPESLPIESTGADLPKIDAGRLTPDGLRARFKQRLPWDPERQESRVTDIRDPREAAVLIPLVIRASGLSVLLTQRADHLSNHAGQVSFPGGSREPSDSTPIAAALREAHEEVDLDPSRVEVLGALPEYLTGTGFRVTPVVGLVHEPFSLAADSLEVASIFEVPLDFLMNPANHEIRVFRWEGGERRFFAMPYPQQGGQAGAVGTSHFIWGATAGMLRNFYRFLLA
ncbi:8-oxo-dGTP pyrophosphatase MutT (NUDIX family) [Paraburkholderia bannensis]|uniref:8-oxo-dGTP pyrophosphatase MutT (NUDIX family) n=1 Tax=Paraburkholderia bannensis TaxID=765414 RepID=A0A7W9TUC0_9BURK|nr:MULTISPECIES: CoA pyrophosphatase [Paraburkholderia]MBB3255614.1 8-oxo-dGTP pyrophosphatase MutT (NUDIX family) [Paraburkholderia sp. WP4_3_2]MBB6100375.1 8-oxo-dGTP pyrophosphatase MutT (NUDIX family) [Paraburkholderia bannensis]